MTPAYIVQELFYQTETPTPNSLLLKKIFLSVFYGWLRINGSPPDAACSLSDYLFDNERIIVDLSRLGELQRAQFITWFLKSHLPEAQKIFLRDRGVKEHGGKIAENELSWWAKWQNILYYKKTCYIWALPSAKHSSMQPLEIEINEGKKGLLIGLHHVVMKWAEKKPFSRYTKRLFLSNNMVTQLMAIDIANVDFAPMIFFPHPFSIKMTQARACDAQPSDSATWYNRFWYKPVKPNADRDISSSEADTKNYELLVCKGQVQVFQQANKGAILIIEKRPDIDSMAFCGGGAKMYAHAGAYKAFEDAKIYPGNFAGSSAGAIMSFLCYLGYTSEEIVTFLRGLRQETIVRVEIERSGISSSGALKAALDYMLMKKISQIIEQYAVEKHWEGRHFLVNTFLKSEKITFESLHKLKALYPDCCIKDRLVVTATNVEQNKTRYFSYADSPDMEVSLAVTMSASFPVVFKYIVYEGATYADGGILDNLPTGVFRDDHSTLLESKDGNCLSLVVFQFDNGPEKNMLEKRTEHVYRENFVSNWWYGMLTGVSDPVSGWENDRRKLLQYSTQVVLMPVDNISARAFDITVDKQELLFNNGYQASKNYINNRYSHTSENPVNEEYLYTTFVNIDEAIYYCCYRDRQDWFDYLAKKAVKQGHDPTHLAKLKERYFNPPLPLTLMPGNNTADWVPVSLQLPSAFPLMITMRLFEALYPLIHSIPESFIKNKQDYKLYQLACHSFSITNPLLCLNWFSQMTDETHILFAVMVQLLSAVKCDSMDSEVVCEKLILIKTLIPCHESAHPGFLGCWNLMPWHSNRILGNLKKGQWQVVTKLCEVLKRLEEPLQTFIPETQIFVDDWVSELENGALADEKPPLSL